jgi:hypothetical protein
MLYSETLSPEALENVLQVIITCLKVASKHDGRVFGGFVRGVIVPRMFDSKARIHYKDVDLWFQTKEKATAFIQAMGADLIPAHVGSGTLNVTEQIYKFGREQYHLIKDGVMMAWIDVVISATIPVNDFNVNTLTARYTNSGAQIFESFGTDGIDTLIDAIHDKKAVMLPDYKLLFSGGYGLIHSDRIKRNYLDHKWIVTYKDQIIPGDANLRWYLNQFNQSSKSVVEAPISTSFEPVVVDQPKQTTTPMVEVPKPVVEVPVITSPKPVVVDQPKQTVISMNPSHPVVVMYGARTCTHWQKLKPIWETDIKSALSKEYPDLRLVTVVADNCSGSFDETIYPKQLKEYARWFPMVLLVPGPVWDTAVQTMNSEHPSPLKDGVQIMNGIQKQHIEYVQTYNIYEVTHYIKWLKQALENPTSGITLTEADASALKDCLTIASKHNGGVFGGFVREVIVPQLFGTKSPLPKETVDLWFTNLSQANAFIAEMGSRLISQLIDSSHKSVPIRWKLVNGGTGKELVSIAIIVSETIPVKDLNVNMLVAFYRNNTVEFQSFGPEPANVLKAYIESKTAILLPSYKSLLTGINKSFHREHLTKKYLDHNWTLIYNGDQKMPSTITDDILITFSI